MVFGLGWVGVVRFCGVVARYLAALIWSESCSRLIVQAVVVRVVVGVTMR